MIGNRDRAIAVIQVFTRVHAHGPVDGGKQVRHRYRTLDHFLANLISHANRLPVLQSATGQSNGKRSRLVSAPATAIEFRRTPKFCGHHDQCLIEQLMGLQIRHQRRQRLIQLLDN